MRQRAAVAMAFVLAVALRPNLAFAQTPDPEEEGQAVPRTAQRGTPTIWQIGSGISYSQGDYGQSPETEVLFVPLSLRLRHGPWSAQLAIAHLTINGPASVIDTSDGGVGASEPGAVPVTGTRAGLGDVSLTLGRRFDLNETLRLTGDVRFKLPTASEAERLTTGTTDITLRARLAQRIGDVTLQAGVRRRFSLGQGRVALRDSWSATAGASIDLGESIVAGADYSWLQSSHGNAAPNSSVTAYLSVPAGRRLRLTGYVGSGLSTNSADLTLGTSVILRLD